MAALEEVVSAGLLVERGRGGEISFAHPLIHRAVYDDLSPSRRRELHGRAAGLVDGRERLDHRVAAAVGTQEALAGELDVAARDAAERGLSGGAGRWLTQAAELSASSQGRERRLLDALEVLLVAGEVGPPQC